MLDTVCGEEPPNVDFPRFMRREFTV
eukprot:SAG11_NODE_10385_length_835_cov_2.839674_1_plen_25_part_10